MELLLAEAGRELTEVLAVLEAVSCSFLVMELPVRERFLPGGLTLLIAEACGERTVELLCELVILVEVTVVPCSVMLVEMTFRVHFLTVESELLLKEAGRERTFSV